MKYEKKFATLSEYNTFLGSDDFITPNVSVVAFDESIYYHPLIVEGDKYLKFTAKQSNSTVKLNRVGTSTSLTNASVEYSTDDGTTWNTYTVSTASTAISLASVGSSVLFRGNNERLSYAASNYHKFVMTGQIEASGDLTSLFNEVGGDVAMVASACSYLFSGCTSLLTAPNLPSTTLASHCYNSLFKGCSALKEIKFYASAFTGCDGWVYGCGAINYMYVKSNLIDANNYSASAKPMYSKYICNVDTLEPVKGRVSSFKIGSTTYPYAGCAKLYGRANGLFTGYAYGVINTGGSTNVYVDNFSNCVFCNPSIPLFVPVGTTSGSYSFGTESMTSSFVGNTYDDCNNAIKEFEMNTTGYGSLSSYSSKSITNIQFYNV